jgi:hypothetical protein
MITVSGKLAREVEYLIEQSIQGHHVLFDPALLKSVLVPTALNQRPNELQHVEPLLEQMLGLPSLAQKRAFMESLNEEEFMGVLRLWFNVVDNSLYHSSHERH